MKRIDILYFDGCPNHAPAVAMARGIAAELGIEIDVNEIHVGTPEEAQAQRFLGSPSIRVDGVDIEPEARERTDYGFSCRTYSGQGLPPREFLIAALTGEAAETANTASAATVASAHDGCAAEAGVPAGNSALLDNSARTGRFAAAGALGAAVIASACCWLPLLLIAFGASAGGAGLFFEKTRPLFLGVAAVMLGFGFYYVYFRKEVCKDGVACAAPNPRIRRLNKISLWIATIGTVAFAMFPAYMDFFIPQSAAASEAVSIDGALEVEFVVSGMTCAGCAVNLENELSHVPGVAAAAVDFDAKRLIVHYDPTRVPSTESLEAAVKTLGYRATALAQQK